MEERSIRYDSSAGQVTVPESEWEHFYGDAGKRSRIAGRYARSFRDYYDDELEKLRYEVRSSYRAKRSAADERQENEQDQKQELVQRASIVADLGKQSFKLQGAHVNMEEQLVFESSDDDDEWDTNEWSKDQVEVTVDYLVAEIRQSSQKKRRRVATGLLRKLLGKHTSAKDHLDLMIGSLSDQSLAISHGEAQRSAASTRLSELLADVASYLPESLSRNGCMKKCVRLLAHKFHIAARVIQTVYRVHQFETCKLNLISWEQRRHRRSMHVALVHDARQQWRKMYHQRIGLLSVEDTLSQIKLLLELCSDHASSAYYRKDRRILVDQCGMYPLQELCLHESMQVRSAASQLILQVVLEPSLCILALRSGVHISLSILLQSELVEDRCIALDVLDIVCNSVCMHKDNTLDTVWNIMEDKTELVKRQKAPEYVRGADPVLRTLEAIQLLSARRRDGGLLRWLKYLLHSDDSLVRLGATMCLLKLASTPCSSLLLCIGEILTIHEQKKEQYEVNRNRRNTHFLQSLLYSASSDDPGLAVASMQVVAQLASNGPCREFLIEIKFSALVLHHFCFPIRMKSLNREVIADKDVQMMQRGLIILVALVGGSTRPLMLADVGDDTSPEWKLKKQFHSILNMDLFANDEEMEVCLQNSLVGMVLLPPEYMKCFCDELFAFPSLLDFLLETNHESSNLEHLYISGYLLGKFCHFVPTVSMTLLHSDRLLQMLVNLIGQTVSETCDSMYQIAQVGCEGACFALLSVARYSSDACGKIANLVAESKVAPSLAQCITSSPVETRISALNLIATLVPWQGLEVESYSDTISSTLSIPVLEQQASDQQEMQDIESAFLDPLSEEAVICIIDSAATSIIKCLKTCTDPGLKQALCYTLARLASTRKMSHRLLECGVLAVIRKLLPSNIPSHQQNTKKGATVCHPMELAMVSPQLRVESLLNLSEPFFTLCAGIARTMSGKYAMVDLGVVRLAIDTLMSIDCTKYQSEAALLLARVANITHKVQGPVNTIMMSDEFMDHLLELATDAAPRRRFHVLLLLGQLIQDEMETVPVLTRQRGIGRMVNILRGLQTDDSSVEKNDMMIRQVLRILHRISNYMMGALHKKLLQTDVMFLLERLSHKTERIGALSRDILDTLSSKPTRNISLTPPLTSSLTMHEGMIDFSTNAFGFKGKPDLKYLLRTGKLGQLSPGYVRGTKTQASKRADHSQFESNSASRFRQKPKLVPISTQDLLSTRPVGKKSTKSPEELAKMHFEYLLLIRPPKPDTKLH